jgi:hypothetical protein
MTEERVLSAPNRMDIPGGRPETVHVNGGLPPPNTEMVRLHGTPSVQSSIDEPEGAIEGSVAAAPTTSIDSVVK